MKSLIISVLLTITVCFVQAAVETYNYPKELMPSKSFKVRVNDNPVFVVHSPIPASYAAFGTSGEATVYIETTTDVKWVDVRPKSLNIKPAIKNKVISFTIPGPCLLSVEINGSINNPLFIFANPIEQKPSKNTLILFASDNGASSEMVNLNDDYGEIGTMTCWSSLGVNWANVGNTPFRFYKNFSYEGGINTPFIAYWPEKIKSNTFSEFPGHFIDIMATLVDITGADYPEKWNEQQIIPMQGQSLLPVFLGENIQREKPIFWEWGRGQAVYSKGYKLVRHGLEKSWDLYKISSDPTETKNIASENPQKVKEMEQLFMDWKKSLLNF